MQNINISTKSPFFIKSNESTVFLTDMGLSAIENLKQSYYKSCLKDFAQVHKFSSILGNGTYLDYYKATTRTYKNLPFFLFSTKTNELAWDVFLENLQDEGFKSFLEKTMLWYTKMGFSLTKLNIREDIKHLVDNQKFASQETIILTPPTDESLIGCEFMLGDSPITIEFFKESSTQEKIDFMNKEGIRLKPFVGRITVFEDLSIILNLLANHYSNTLPSEISPIKAVVLSVSEKWEQLANLVALKLGAQVDNSSDAVGKKIRYWKSLGCSEIYVVGEKDMKELCESGKITLMKNSINAVMEPVVIYFI